MKNYRKTIQKIVLASIVYFAVGNRVDAQLVWQKGGNTSAPGGIPPTIGTNYVAPLQFLTNSAERMRTYTVFRCYSSLPKSIILTN